MKPIFLSFDISVQCRSTIIMANKYQIVKTFRRLFRRFQYIHPSKRHIVLITLCFWLSAITLWTIRRSPLNNNNNESLNPNTNILDNVVLEIFSGETNPYYNEIDKWHRNDSNLPKLFPTSQTSSRSEFRNTNVEKFTKDFLNFFP